MKLKELIEKEQDDFDQILDQGMLRIKHGNSWKTLKGKADSEQPKEEQKERVAEYDEINVSYCKKFSSVCWRNNR